MLPPVARERSRRAIRSPTAELKAQRMHRLCIAGLRNRHRDLVGPHRRAVERVSLRERRGRAREGQPEQNDASRNHELGGSVHVAPTEE